MVAACIRSNMATVDARPSDNHDQLPTPQPQFLIRCGIVDADKDPMGPSDADKDPMGPSELLGGVIK